MMMKKICYFFLFSLVFCLFLVLPSLAVSSNTFEIFWVDNDTIGVPYNASLNNYTVYCVDATDTLDIYLLFNNDDFDLARAPYYSFDIPTSFHATYYVVAEYITEPEDTYTSNQLAYNSNGVLLTWTTDTGINPSLSWVIPDDLPYTTVYLQYSYLGNGGWVTGPYWSRSNVNSYTLTNTAYRGAYFRIMVDVGVNSSGNRLYTYSNTVYCNYPIGQLDIPDMTDSITFAPSESLPEVDPHYVYPTLDVLRVNRMAFAGVFNSNLAKYFFFGVTLLTSFAALAYVLFKWH